MLNKVKKRILVAPLDWGLGHATRCIPIIRELLNAGFEVFIAADGKIKILLLREFPYVSFVPLKGYDIKYSRTKAGLCVKIFFQIPAIIAAIRHEKRWLREIIREYQIDLVLSDNRYGLHHDYIPSIFITHQLRIQTPLFEPLLQRINYRFINRFRECWIPDDEVKPGLAGNLSHPLKKPAIPLKYLGPLSRFQYMEDVAEEKHLLILLSGPEPQRTILEIKLIEQLEQYTLPVFFVRGLPEEEQPMALGPNIKVINHLPAKELEEIILQSSLIVARCGYSTVMDILRLQKKSILIPTPGQTEQEYLAKHLTHSHLACCMPQKEFVLKQSLETAKSFPYRTYSCNDDSLKKAVRQLADILE
jgi:uncharacterized protein (TIGR00661 family)